MKKYLFLLIIALFAMGVHAQDTMLTKEETINYLNKKLQEVDGRITIEPTKTHQFSYLSIRARGSDLELKHIDTRVGGQACSVVQVFNPRDIFRLSVSELATKESPVRLLKIEFAKKLASSEIRCAGEHVLKDVDRVHMPFFDTLTGNRQRFEKALMHLRDLARAEDDPFGN